MRRIVLLLLGGVWLLGAMGLLSGCRHDGSQSILPAACRLSPGDVVFRRGGGVTSHAVLLADGGGVYSHVGIVVDSCGVAMIVHAVPGEPDFEGDEDRVKLDEVEKFFSSIYANKGAVMRCQDSLKASVAEDVALSVYRRGVLFDHDYEIGDTTKMYCTEVVMYAYQRAGLNLVSNAPHGISLPLVQTDVYFPSDVYESKWLRTIVSF